MHDDALSVYAKARTLLEVCPGLVVPIAGRNETGRCGALPFGSSVAVVYLIFERQREVLVQWIG